MRIILRKTRKGSFKLTIYEKMFGMGTHYDTTEKADVIKFLEEVL